MNKKNDKNRPVVVDLMDVPPEGAVFDLSISPALIGLSVCEDNTEKEICFGKDIEISLDIKFIGGNYEIKASVFAVSFLSCVRCLEIFEFPVKSEFYMAAFDDYSEEREFSPGKLDITAELYDDIIVNLPEYPHCRDDCKGLCPGCGADLNKTSCICGKLDI